MSTERMMVSVPKHILPAGAIIQAVLAVVLVQNASVRWCFLCALVGNFVCYAVYSIAIYPRWFSPFRRLPKPRKSNMLLGHALAEFQMPRGDSYLRFMNETSNAGILHLQGLFGSDQLLLTSTAALTETLVQRAYDFEWPEGDRGFLRRILGSGLITAQGHVHKMQRKHMAQGFGVKSIRGLYPLFWEHSRGLVRGIARELVMHYPNGDYAGPNSISGVTDVCSWAQRVSLDIIGRAGFGWEFNTIENPDNELASNFERIFAPTLSNALLFGVSVYGPEWALNYVPAGISRDFVAATAKVHEVCRAFIRSTSKATCTERPNDNILSQLLKQESMTEDSLVDQTLTFLTAGHETVAIALTWAIYLLAKDPKTQTHLRAELRNALPSAELLSDNNNLPSILESLPLLNGVVNETLRLYPSAPVAVRVSIRDTSILGTPVPKGTRLIIAPWSVNRSRDLWGPSAESFVPERWIDVHTPNITAGAGSTTINTAATTAATAAAAANKPPLLTFLQGPRNCIGQGFARAELLTLVAVFVRAFEVALVDFADIKLPGGSLSAKPAGGMRLRIRVVDEAFVQ
ncbi:cytochrome P450 monooxygenase [Aspergillus karnatakaensis]|uniref:cytochrome P450 n=1 Tax=Aspergillus karnatakaensis TaxID=1810916 RepID=UPI003CCE3B69